MKVQIEAAPTPSRVLTIYIPRTHEDPKKHESPTRRAIVPAAAIVGEPNADADTVLVYFEGNLYDAMNMRRFDERLLHAAGRLVSRYPTTAFMVVPKQDLIVVGQFEYETKRMTILEPELLATWAGESIRTGLTKAQHEAEQIEMWEKSRDSGIPFQATPYLI